VNVMVMNPGNYRFRDYLRVGHPADRPVICGDPVRAGVVGKIELSLVEEGFYIFLPHNEVVG